MPGGVKDQHKRGSGDSFLAQVCVYECVFTLCHLVNPQPSSTDTASRKLLKP